MPSLKCTYAEFIEILRKYGFSLHRHDGGSHQIWRGEVAKQLRYVTVAAHQMSANIPIGTLQAMIRQSGLPSKLFRK